MHSIDYRTDTIRSALMILGVKSRDIATLDQLLEILENSKPRLIASTTEKEIIGIIERIIDCVKKDKGEKRASSLLLKLKDRVDFSRDWD